MDLLIWILTGALVGWVASRILKNKKISLIGYIVIGILGSFVGGYIFDFLGLNLGGTIGSFVTSVAGAIIVLFLYNKLKK